MIDWLRLLLMIFYAPVRGMREVRDRSSLAPNALLAVLSQLGFNILCRRYGAVPMVPPRGGLLSVITEPAMPAILIAVVLVPILTLVTNMFERRGSFRVVITQEFAPVAGSLLYVLTAANAFGILIAAFLHYTGIQAQYIANMIQQADQVRAMFPAGPEFDQSAELLKNPGIVADQLFRTPRLLVFFIGMVLAVKDAFRMSLTRSLAVTVLSSFAFMFVGPIVEQLLSSVMGSPFLLFFAFMLLRGYFG